MIQLRADANKALNHDSQSVKQGNRGLSQGIYKYKASPKIVVQSVRDRQVFTKDRL